MKKAYQKPTMAAQLFAANEYVAACGDSGTTYLFDCNATDGHRHLDNHPYHVWIETNGTDGLQTGLFGDTRITDTDEKPPYTTKRMGTYGPCHTKHNASSMDPFYSGYIKATNSWGIEYPVVSVKVWTEGGKNIHCTENLDVNSWETANS